MIHAHGCQALKKAQCFHLNELIQGAYLQTGSSLIPQDRFGAYYLIIILGDLCNELHWSICMPVKKISSKIGLLYYYCTTQTYLPLLLSLVQHRTTVQSLVFGLHS